MKNLKIMIENTIEWALQHLNSTEYTFMCLGFIEDALERSNNIEIFGGDTAKESADLYKDSMLTGMPQKGTFVFYNCCGIISGIAKKLGTCWFSDAGWKSHSCLGQGQDRWLYGYRIT